MSVEHKRERHENRQQTWRWWVLLDSGINVQETSNVHLIFNQRSLELLETPPAKEPAVAPPNKPSPVTIGYTTCSGRIMRPPSYLQDFVTGHWLNLDWPLNIDWILIELDWTLINNWTLIEPWTPSNLKPWTLTLTLNLEHRLNITWTLIEHLTFLGHWFTQVSDFILVKH